jgi:nucleoside-diphosphate-sugar epimerase
VRILVLGGSVFLSRQVAAVAHGRGHDVTCASRGVSGQPPEGTRFVRIDRTDISAYASLAGESFDAVVDVAEQPGQVRGALDALADRVNHWTFVSTISVYTDLATPGQDETAPVHQLNPAGGEESDEYGARKVACEYAVREVLGDRALIVRPGLIVGPGDDGDRFGYWPLRLADTAARPEVLAPGHPDDLVQCVDVRDLAAWTVDCAERGTTGLYNATSAPMTRAAFLDQVAAGVGGAPRLTWVDQEFLLAHQVKPWAGACSLPLWVPLPQAGGLMSISVAAHVAGLRCRNLADTARDTLAWERTVTDTHQLKAGLTSEEETDLLHAWAGSCPRRGPSTPR